MNARQHLAAFAGTLAAGSMKRVAVHVHATLRQWRYLIAITTIAFAVAAFVAATEPWFGPATRFRVIMAAILIQSLILVALLSKFFDLIGELRSQHTAATHIRTLRGIWLSLESYAESGGVDMDYRRTLHRAGHRQFDLYDQVLGGDVDGVTELFQPTRTIRPRR